MDVVGPVLKAVNRVSPCFASAAVGIIYRRELNDVYERHFGALMDNDASHWRESINAQNLASRIAYSYYYDERDAILERIIG
ncbi:MAG: hypothetical protein AB8B83_07610 [Bdellovibrionales bacterium]